jgi:tRNA pseudouridine55 synthase
MTSHDVVARVRRIIGERRVGHAGTLDPMATGLLVLGIGPSTRLLRFAQAETKHYVGDVTFGVATDSLDADGAVVDVRDVPVLTPASVADGAATLLGRQRQVPPMVSALKVGGRRLYELARAGHEVEREARDITVDEFILSGTDDPGVWHFDVRCSVGTYVRVLLSDLAEHLGTVGHLSALRRLASGTHDVRDARTLDELVASLERGEQCVVAPAHFVEALEHVSLDDDEVRRMRMGQRLSLTNRFDTDEIAALSGTGELVGTLVRRDQLWKPELVLAVSDPAHG